jgi:hypothetical protein
MKDYLNSQERTQLMVFLSILQMLEGKRRGMDGAKLGTMLEEWSKRDNLTKDEHKFLKTSTTYLKKFSTSIFERLGLKEKQTLANKLAKFDFRLVDDFTLKQVHRDMTDRMVNAVVPRQQFYDFCKEIMEVKCNGCTKDWKECELHEMFDDNFIPESGFDCSNCRYAYKK